MSMDTDKFAHKLICVCCGVEFTEECPDLKMCGSCELEDYYRAEAIAMVEYYAQYDPNYVAPKPKPGTKPSDTILVFTNYPRR